MSSGESVTVMVRYARGNGNALPFKCKTSDTIFDLAKDIKRQANLFDLDERNIRFTTLKMFSCREDGSKALLHFGDEIGVLRRKGFEVEFDTEYTKLLVKYIDSVNPTKFEIESSKDACDLVEVVLENLDNFHLSEEDLQTIRAPGNEIRLLRKIADAYEPISPVISIAELTQDIIEFEIVTLDMKRRGKRINISVRFRKSPTIVPLECWENDTVYMFVELIKRNSDKFGLSPDTRHSLSNPSKEIVLSPSTTQRGAYVEALNPSQKLGKVTERELTFDILDRKQPPSKDELAELCAGQKIAIFGAVGHGKTSTINTIARAFPGVQDSIAETSGGEATGTHVVSPHTFKIRDKLFHLIDVPGGGLPSGEKSDGRERLEKVISWIIDGRFPEDLPTNYWDKSNVLQGWYKYVTRKSIGKVDAVVIVHRGYAPEVDVLTRLVCDVALSKGRGIPVFGIITNIDKLKDDAEIQDKVAYLSLAANIDASNIYPLCNIQEGPSSSQQGGRDRDEYVLCMLRSILSRSKRSQRSREPVDLT
ncbi:uncharacterized protein [Ptychodera flava]|uniref:uncharacterized protein n=1 Tax=Ptychodera flava TaxID=63121 RepID=UPI00396AB156